MKKIFKKIIVKLLEWEAKLVLKKYKPKIIAITGSVGKTSTKDAVYTVLSKFHTVRKSDKSFNSEIGLPLTIIGCPNGWSNPFIWIENLFKGLLLILWKHNYPSWLVLEVGAGKPGDIKSVSKWLHPDIVVITRFPDKPVHIEFFGTAEKLIEEKSYLAHALKESGVLILNHDDEKVYALHHKVKRRIVSFGTHENSTYHATYLATYHRQWNDISVPDGINFKLEYSGNVFPVVLPHVVGMHNVASALSALACAREAGCDILLAVSALGEYHTPPGRLSLIQGMNESVIIDDTYNASPVAMEVAIEILSSINSKRKIAVLGDMLELGKFTEEAHRAVGANLLGIADILVAVGPRAKFIASGALDAGFKAKEIYQFDSSITAGKFLNGIVERGDVVLLKGSQGVRLERAVEMIMASPKDKKHLLARQEKEWQNR